MSETQVAQTEKILCGGRGRTDRSGTNADKLFRLPINSLLRIRASEELVVAQSLEGRCGSVGRGCLTCCAPPAQPAAHGALAEACRSVCRKSSGGIPVAVGEDASHVTLLLVRGTRAVVSGCSDPTEAENITCVLLEGESPV